MRLLSRLLVVLVICLVAIALPAAPTQADSEGPSIRLFRSHGMPGTLVTVHGDNFTADERVYIYYDHNGDDEQVAREDTDEHGDFQVTFEVPESYTGEHYVSAYIGTSLQAIDEFTVEPGLTINVEQGIVGTTVTVKGHGFAEEEENIDLLYYLYGEDFEAVVEHIEANDDGSWERSFEIPHSAKGSHEIDAEGDESQDYDVEGVTFEVIPGISIIDQASGSTIEEPSGSPGASITMTGSGFEDDDRYIKILFAGEEAETEPEIIRAGENGNWTASFKVPQMPTGTYSVTAEGERTDKEDINELSFEIGAGLVLSPEEGHVGTNLTVTGRGFAADKNVVIKYESKEKLTRTDGEGSFEVSLLVPKSKHGAHNVTAEVGGKTEATANFTMESDSPPTPTLSSPPDEDRVGFTGRVRPTFEWSEVSDISGVYYSLQIATSANFTATGFADPIVSIPNIVGTNYTLEKTEALPYGTYYWIVQAVDGAENESGWTEARSFRAGLLPLWAFIVIIVAIAAGIGAAIYFFVIRRRIYYY